ncbi:hypothetical protein Tco_0856674 [Tanacetum coccineum]|uniref:Uncharacterized protein n=1 Tax=Tanacetum coccineum TaxID=301880 RepID=A0ABQ5B649_9ASTR
MGSSLQILLKKTEGALQPVTETLLAVYTDFLLKNKVVQQYPTQSSMSPQSSNEPSHDDNFQLDSPEVLQYTCQLEFERTKLRLRRRVVVQDVLKIHANNQGRHSEELCRGNVVTGMLTKVEQRDKMILVQAQEEWCEYWMKQQFVFLDRRTGCVICDAFDFDVDEAPNIQTMFMVNLSSEDPIYDEAGPSYELDYSM